MWKWMGLFWKKNHLSICWDWLSVLNWIGTLTLSLLLKLPSLKLKPPFILWSFILLRLLCISINLPHYHTQIYHTIPCLKYCCSYFCYCFFYVWAGATSCYLELLDKPQKWISRTVGCLLAASLAASLEGSLLNNSNKLHDFSITIPRSHKDVSVNSLFPQTAKLWNSLTIECYISNYDINAFKSRINRRLLSVGSF